MRPKSKLNSQWFIISKPSSILVDVNLITLHCTHPIKARAKAMTAKPVGATLLISSFVIGTSSSADDPILYRISTSSKPM